MQTFAPEGTDIVKGFKQLDYRRLGKQRVETWQILNVLRGVDNEGNPKEHKGWVNHPATRMWRGHAPALAYYGLLSCYEWQRRGFNDTMATRFMHALWKLWEEGQVYADPASTPVRMPVFLDAIMESHRSNLIRKDPEFYQPKWPTTPDDIPYVWPS